MSHVSHRLKGPLEGALAGGGDPASSPLYVFGPFLKLLAASGVGAVSFGAPLWMVVATVGVVSLMYRNVMRWIPDGSGGSGLCEEEFGSWAVKINAGITAIEYTLTFLVSIAALVTFVADRAGGLGRIPRTALALGFSVLVGFVVNRGPRLAARVFGPATAAVLLLLWVLVGATIVKRGLHLPPLDLHAFDGAHLHVTFGSYVRLLALMTGIEVFANLVAAYDGSPAERAAKAFRSLLIVMVTTLVTMVVVGPAILAISDPENPDVSVITQTMDHLLPAPVAYAGTLVGIVVLLSAAAASSQGLQNLALGLRFRHYVPASFGTRNRFDVADRPVVVQVLVCLACFVALGTHEDTYLTLYAAGVFVLLGLTGWAAVKRLGRELRGGASVRAGAALVGTVLAALVSTAAASLIFYERFLDGAWAYMLIVPAFYALFTYFRRKLGAPTELEKNPEAVLAERAEPDHPKKPEWPRGIMAVVDGSNSAEAGLIAANGIGALFEARVDVCGLLAPDAEAYLESLQRGFRLDTPPSAAKSATEALARAHEVGAELLVATRELKGFKALRDSADLPLLVIGADVAGRYPKLRNVVVGLDGSAEAEATLPILQRLLDAGAKAHLVLAPESDANNDALSSYAERIGAGLRGDITFAAAGSGATRTLVEQAKDRKADLVLVARHGRGGAHRAAKIPLGSVPESLIQQLGCALLIVPAAVSAADPEPAAEPAHA